jgi:hypothetical protein
MFDQFGDKRIKREGAVYILVGGYGKSIHPYNKGSFQGKIKGSETIGIIYLVGVYVKSIGDEGACRKQLIRLLVNGKGIELSL